MPQSVIDGDSDAAAGEDAVRAVTISRALVGA